MVPAEKYEEYCRVLGVKPGSGADEVKRAFRTRIKTHHPDRSRESSADERTARLLIEAYSAFKKGVPPRGRQEGAYTVYRRGEASADSGGESAARPRGQRGTTYRSGQEAGRRIFEAFERARAERERAERAESPFFGNIWQNLAHFLYADDEEFAVYGENIEVREYTPRVRKAVHSKLFDEFIDTDPLDAANEYYERAEANLRMVVQRFDGVRHRFRRSWARDFIGELNRVQVLYRDVSRRYPNYAARALQRVRQIRELMFEIRSSV